MRSDVVETFVRGSLGCQCPAAVFAQVRWDDVQVTGLAGTVRRIAVGGRLLIYLWEAATADAIEAALSVLMDAGRCDRDAHGFRRVRMVFVTDAAVPDSALQDRFAALAGHDERLHLHVLGRSAAARILAHTSVMSGGQSSAGCGTA